MSLILEHNETEEEWRKVKNKLCQPSHSHPAHFSNPYQNSGFWDIPGRPVHCSYRLFIVVIPPLCLIDEHGQLGHTLLSGPLHRHSQRIIMLHYLIAFIYSSVLMASTVEGVEVY